MPPRTSNFQLALEHLGRVHNHFLPAFTAAPPATTPLETSAQLALAKRVISEYDSAIHALHSSVVQDGSSGRSRLVSSILDRLAHTSPFYRIPVEIWVHIFKIFTSEDPRHDSLHPTSPRNVLCRVCRGWRHIVQSLPEMWSLIWLHKSWKVPPRARGSFMGFLDTRQRLLDDILRFSGDLPLVILIDAPESVELKGVLETLALHTLLTLVQHSHRWGALRIVEEYPHEVAHALVSSIKMVGVTVFPCLQELYLHLSGSWEENEPEFCDLPFPNNSLPNLDFIHLQLHGSDYRRILHSLQFCTTASINKLIKPPTTSYGFSYVSRDHRFFDGYDDYSHPDYRKEFTLPYLKTLSVRIWDSEFFVFMTAPALSEIYIETIHDSSIARDVQNLITKSHCSITTFAFGLIFSRYWSLSQNPQLFQDLLASLPNLQNLVLCQVHCEYSESLSREHDRSSEREATISAFLTPLGQTTNGQISNCALLQYLHISPTEAPSPLPHLTLARMTQLVDVMEMRWRSAIPGDFGLCEVTGIPELGEDSFPEGQLAQYERLKALEGEGLKVAYAK